MSLRLMSLLGGGFNFFFNFHPYFSNGLVKLPTRLVFSLPSTNPAFPNRKPHDGERLRAWSLCCCRNWGLVGRLCWQPAPKAGIIFRLKKKQTAVEVGVFLLIFVVCFFLCCLVGKATGFSSFCLLLLVFFLLVFFFSLVGKAKQKHQNVQPSGNIYILLILYRGCNTTHSGSVGCCFLCWLLFSFIFFGAGVFWRKLGEMLVFFSRCGRDFSWILEMLEQKQTMGIQMANKTQKAERVQV